MMPAGKMINWSVLASIKVCRVLHDGSMSASVPWRVRVRRRGRVSGELPAVPTACTVGWNLSGWLRVYRVPVWRVKPNRRDGYA